MKNNSKSNFFQVEENHFLVETPKKKNYIMFVALKLSMCQLCIQDALASGYNVGTASRARIIHECE